MKTLQDFLSSLYDRLANPFVVSILLSWLVWNWEITLVLFWPESTIRPVLGTKTITQFIIDHKSVCRSFLYPLFCGIAITILINASNVLLAVIQSIAQKYRDLFSINILKLSSIPIGRYLSLREKYDSSQISLDALIRIETTVDQENQDLNRQIAEERDRSRMAIEESSNTKSKLREANDVNYLNGEWRNNWGEGNEAYKHSERVFIENGKYFIRLNDSLVHVFNIIGFQRNLDTGELFFIKDRFELTQTVKPIEEGRFELKLNPNFLNIMRDGYLEGRENHETFIRYTRLK